MDRERKEDSRWVSQQNHEVKASTAAPIPALCPRGPLHSWVFVVLVQLWPKAVKERQCQAFRQRRERRGNVTSATISTTAVTAFELCDGVHLGALKAAHNEGLALLTMFAVYVLFLPFLIPSRVEALYCCLSLEASLCVCHSESIQQMWAELKWVELHKSFQPWK